MRIPQITSKTDSCLKSIASGIITNSSTRTLSARRWKDIQSAALYLMGELSRSSLCRKTDSEYWIKMLVQIREAYREAPQSAQLVATNREYQSASRRSRATSGDIATDMEQISYSATTRCASGESGSATAITDLLGRLKRSGKTLRLSNCATNAAHRIERLGGASAICFRTRRSAARAPPARAKSCPTSRSCTRQFLQGGHGGENLNEILAARRCWMTRSRSRLRLRGQQWPSQCAWSWRSTRRSWEGEMPLWKGFSEGWRSGWPFIALSSAQTGVRARRCWRGSSR